MRICCARMIDVTALIEGPGASPQRLVHWRRASAIGSNARGGGTSEDRRLRVGAPHVLERGHDLPLRRVRAGAVEEQRHEVSASAGGLVTASLVAGRRGAQPSEHRLDRRAVATGADRLHAADLLALERRVDAEDLRVAAVALE